MTNRLLIILIFLCNKSFGQSPTQPTQFDKFVNKSRIEWAAYASDTFHFPLLNKILLERLQEKQIKASIPFDSRTAEANDVKYVSLDSIDKAYYGDDPVVKIDSSNFRTTEITQILYVEKGCLQSYIPFVTPTLPVYISSGTYIGQRFYFNSAYNYKYDYSPKKRNKLSYLGETTKMIKLDDKQNALKQMYGRNLLEMLWPSVNQGSIGLFTGDGKLKLDPKEVDINLVNKQNFPVPVYDSITRITKYVVSEGIAEPGRFTDLQLIQDWFYDHKKNRVISCIKTVYVYKTAAAKKEKNPDPSFKMVFK